VYKPVATENTKIIMAAPSQELLAEGASIAFKPLMQVYAVKDLSAGDELFLDYGKDFWRK